jgi:hypothetical protein
MRDLRGEVLGNGLVRVRDYGSGLCSLWEPKGGHVVHHSGDLRGADVMREATKTWQYHRLGPRLGEAETLSWGK